MATKMTPANMYRVGDYVYFEAHSGAPLHIRRIDELSKTPAGNVEARVLVYCRRRDLPENLLRSLTMCSQNSAKQSSKNADIEQPQEIDTTTAAAAASAEVDSATDTAATVSTVVTAAAVDAPESVRMETEGKEEAAELMTVEAKSTSTDTCVTSTLDTGVAEAATEELKKEPIPDVPIAAIAGQDVLSDEEKHMLVHRELFLTRQFETLPATHIRGKCTVSLLSEVENAHTYLNKEDAFYYSLIYDSQHKTVLADKGEIRIGPEFQADVPEKMDENTDVADEPEREVLLYNGLNGLSDAQIDQYLVVAKAVGTFARAVDISSTVKIPNLHMSAAAASRDVTTMQALSILHKANYDIGKAVCMMVPPANRDSSSFIDENGTGMNTISVGGPLISRDQLEEWSASEANLFEEALEKYGKDFSDIRHDFLPWKQLSDIIEYYYMYKTTDRYVQQRRAKAAEAETRLKQVYIPAYTKVSPNVIPTTAGSQPLFTCESCETQKSDQWYAWGPSAVPQMRLCKDCWSYWKRYGGLKRKHQFACIFFTLYLIEIFDKELAVDTSDSNGRDSQDVTGEGGRQMRCAVVNCNRTFANIQLLNQHLRRDHSVAYPTSANGLGHVPNSAGIRLISGAHSTKVPVSQPRPRTSIYMQTSLWCRVARRMAPKNLFNIRHFARHPCEPINANAIAANCQAQHLTKVQLVAAQLIHSSQLLASKPPRSVTPAVHRGKNRHRYAEQKPVKRNIGVEILAHATNGRHALISYAQWVNESIDCYLYPRGLVKEARKLALTPPLYRYLARNPFRVLESALIILQQTLIMVESAENSVVVMLRQRRLDNAAPTVYEKRNARRQTTEQQQLDFSVHDPIDAMEIFDLIRDIKDPEHPFTLEELNVVSLENIEVEDKGVGRVVVYFTPTIPHCSMAVIIGLCIRTKLSHSLPRRFKIDVQLTPGSHDMDAQLSKQLADKERVAAALERPEIFQSVISCIYN
ncbi:Metastasis-associated protein MTA3 [Trichinella pseudospiralis]|uniref:Metastasis-associated protein MTA3 n=1 Tax=Trichinella pseudospiralis TaxID=6337 RepID=A0A0V1EE21_TRIPS|nr:Metastasis-associated protein MTA3 [Trichinella pseudospiralis]KRZ31212.1 Metastasis-associated protein MTA3 [Trichinella pseudospiralis]